MPPPSNGNPMNFTDIPFDYVGAISAYWVNSELVIIIMIIMMMCSLFQTPLLLLIYYKLR